jgi:hypothetical protein
MSVVPSIIVLVITALLVFRYELTHLAAPASKPTPAPRRRPLRQSKASKEFGRGASRSAPSTSQMRLRTSRASRLTAAHSAPGGEFGTVEKL